MKYQSEGRNYWQMEHAMLGMRAEHWLLDLGPVASTAKRKWKKKSSLLHVSEGRFL